MEKTAILGKEYDVALRQTLRDILHELSGITVEESWGVGGSQEVGSVQVRIGSEIITAEAETYAGLSIAGESGLVDRIAAAVRERAMPSE